MMSAGVQSVLIKVSSADNSSRTSRNAFYLGMIEYFSEIILIKETSPRLIKQ